MTQKEYKVGDVVDFEVSNLKGIGTITPYNGDIMYAVIIEEFPGIPSRTKWHIFPDEITGIHVEPRIEFDITKDRRLELEL
jgi:hypothetical protein